MPTIDEQIDAVASRLVTAKTIGVLTGAGISAESGIRTFRDTMEGLWKDFDPQKLATPEAFAANPALVTKWYDWRRQGCLAAEPNPGHLALAELENWLESRAGKLVILTQNVDGLHQRAGSRNVVELHGSIHIWRCTATGCESRPAPEAFTEFPPKTPSGTPMRPAIVWFGEPLPIDAIRTAAQTAATCDVFFSIGTSAIVYPAAGFVEEASANGAITVEINKDPTPLSNRVDFSLRGPSGDLLPRIVRHAKHRS